MTFLRPLKRPARLGRALFALVALAGSIGILLSGHLLIGLFWLAFGLRYGSALILPLLARAWRALVRLSDAVEAYERPESR